MSDTIKKWTPRGLEFWEEKAHANGKGQPQVTDDDLKRFVEQQVTLSADDDAALNKAKPSLKREVLSILSKPFTIKPKAAKRMLNHKARRAAMREIKDEV